MPLKITRAEEPIPVDRLVVVIVGQPGICKTSLSYTASKPLLFDFDNGSYRAIGRKDTVLIKSWADVEGMTRDDVDGFDTIVIDTVGRALDYLTTDIIEKNYKHGSQGSLNQAGWGMLKSRFTAFVGQFKTWGKDVVLIAHMKEEIGGDATLERLDVQGGSKGEIYKAADCMGRLTIQNGKRVLLFSPTDAAFGKNPAQLPPIQVPDQTSPHFEHFLAGIITATKEKLNQMTEAQKEALEEQRWFEKALAEVDTPSKLNGLIERSKTAPEVCRKMIVRKAKELDYSFDRVKGEYA